MNRRDDNLLNLETLKTYFLKNAFDDQTVMLLRSKPKEGDMKEYAVLDDAFIKS